MYNLNSNYGQLQAIATAVVGPTFGRFAVVIPDGDTTNTDRARQIFTSDPNGGTIRMFTTIEAAYEWAISSKDDVIFLSGGTTHTLTGMLTTAKNRVHFIGLDGGTKRMMSQGAKVQITGTQAASSLAPVLNTGVRNSFVNIKFINNSATNTALYGFIDNGEATYIEGCHMVKTAGLDDANHAHFWMAGDSLTMRNSTIGQSNTPNTAAGFGILIDGKTGGATDGTVKENYLENIFINMSVGGSVQSTSAFIKIADTAALNFANGINGLFGVNFIPVGGTAMTDAVLGVNSTVSGTLALRNPSFHGCTGVGAGATQGVTISAGGVAPVAAGGLATALTD